MGNMSYCRFQNTKSDVYDCINALEENKISSEEEKEAAKRMFKSILKYCENEEIIDGYDEEHLNNIIDNMEIEK